MRLGVAAIAAPRFDIDLAEETATRAFAVIDSLDDVATIGPRQLVVEHAQLLDAKADLVAGDLDGLLVLQASFADSTLVAALAEVTDGPITLWAFPEPRTGGPLRLNSLSGINLASFVLRTSGRDVRYLYTDPWAGDAAGTLRDVLGPPRHGGGAPIDQAATGYPASPAAVEAAIDIAERLTEARIGIVGDPPIGLEPCGFDAGALRAATGVHGESTPLLQLLDRAEEVADDRVTAVRAAYGAQLANLESVDATATGQTARLHLALLDTAGERGWDGVAMRCWPECFTEFRGAACAAQSLLDQQHGIPTACEADAYGAITGLILRWFGGGPSCIADLVHLDAADDTAVLWRCGIAPIDMAYDEATPTAADHPVWHLPLLYEFPMRPGRITLARLSQSRGRHRLVVGGGEMLRAPLAFTGTAGVVRFDRSVTDVLETVMTEGLEHHLAIVYGDVRDELRALAGRLDLPLIEL